MILKSYNNKIGFFVEFSNKDVYCNWYDRGRGERTCNYALKRHIEKRTHTWLYIKDTQVIFGRKKECDKFKKRQTR